ncbi:MAG: hypothetical protein WCL14_01710 [Bacteroidota bacterium]
MKGAEKFYERCRKMIILAYKKSFYSFASADINMLSDILGTRVTNFVANRNNN